jgi:hypothetical protein
MKINYARVLYETIEVTIICSAICMGLIRIQPSFVLLLVR